jgi:uncharacterized repeat protein (TIGR03803 family)
MATKI